MLLAKSSHSLPYAINKLKREFWVGWIKNQAWESTVIKNQPIGTRYIYLHLENIVCHYFRQLWLVLGVKLMEINSKWFSRYLHLLDINDKFVGKYTELVPWIRHWVTKTPVKKWTFLFAPPKRGSLYYQPKQCIINGKSLKFTIHLYCLMPLK